MVNKREKPGRTTTCDNLNPYGVEDSSGSSYGLELEPSLVGLGGRIAQAALRVTPGGKRELARRVSIRENQVYRYIRGDSVPSAHMVVLLAHATGVSPCWLLTGEGSMELGVREVGRGRVESELLQDVLVVLEEEIQARDTKLGPEKKARVIAALYELFVLEHRVDAGVVRSVIDWAA